MFARYAIKEVLIIFIIGAAATVAVGLWLGWWAIAPGVVTLALLAFYRDPPRSVPNDDNILVSPADGWIVAVDYGTGEAASHPEFQTAPTGATRPRSTRPPDASSPGDRLLISIFLTVVDVHLNRAPCRGTVRTVTYKRGEFLNALKPESVARNEQNAILIDPPPPLPGPVEVVQIAGGLARRIVCAAEVGDSLAVGQRFGMIKLGSRTIVTVPDAPRWEVLVRVGQHVRGGATILARLRGSA